MKETTTYKLKSVDYARLIQYAAQKFHKVLLNKTQINKILFYVYGVYYARKKELLFDDDVPQAWPYGPVFPIPNKRVVVDEIITSFPHEQVEAFKNQPDVLQLVKDAVDSMYDMSAVALTRWSHQEGSPWYKTIYPNSIENQQPWATEIKPDLIKDYFSKYQIFSK